MKILNSPRLSFRLMGQQDAELIFELDQDIEVMRFINGGKLTSLETIRKVYMPRLKSFTNAAEGWGLWQVRVIDSDEYVGWILVRPVGFFDGLPQLDNLEIGWRFKRSSWGKGFATEAAKAVIVAIDLQGKASRVTANTVPDNLASIKVMERLGMQYMKTDIHRDPLGDMESVFYELKLKR